MQDEWLHKDLYPERRGNTYKRNWLKTIFGLEGKEEIEKIKCERNVYWCLRNSMFHNIHIYKYIHI